jgi:hypothetical protein
VHGVLPEKLLEKWRPAELAASAADCLVSAHFRTRGFDVLRFWTSEQEDSNTSLKRGLGRQSMRLDTLMKRMTETNGVRQYSLAGLAAACLPPKLRPPVPELCRDLNCRYRSIWAAPAGRFWGSHVDACPVLLGGLSGRKRVIVAPPDSQGLYPLTRNPLLSEIPDVRCVDRSRFPLFGRSLLSEATIDPGDLLYLPPYWWHQVCYVTLSFGVSYWPGN